jgi:hypothetical protein
MKLPNAELAVINPDKLRDYLLNQGHRRGASKARLLHSLGYRREKWRQLEEDLRRYHLPADVVMTTQTAYGPRYEIVAAIPTPIGRSVSFRSIWQIDTGTDRPKFITMYPE